MTSPHQIPDASLIGRTMGRQAWAKVNLTLHVTGQRSDGYHLLDSMVVRAAVGDRVTVKAADALHLTVDGPEAEGVPVDSRNLVARAALLLDRGVGRGAALHLKKVLPHAAGIGGGSADAAAALHLLASHWGLTPEGDFAGTLGADVPVCLSDYPQRMRGIGDVLDPLPALPQMWMVLANPRVEVPTGAVFQALSSKQNPPMPDLLPQFASVFEAATWLGRQRNDLEGPACRLVPEISHCLNALGDALLARMSGSGATCFGLYESASLAEAAAGRTRSAHPDWWVVACKVIS